MKLRAKMLSSFGVLIFVLLASGSVAVVAFLTVTRGTETLVEELFPSNTAVLTTQIEVTRANLRLERILQGVESVDRFQAVEESLTNASTEIDRIIGHVEALNDAGNMSDQQYQRALGTLPPVKNTLEKLQELSRQRLDFYTSTGEPLASLGLQFDSMYDRFVTQSNLLRDLVGELVEAQENEVYRRIRIGLSVIAGAAMVSVLLALIVAVVFSGRIVARLRMIGAFGERLSRGDLTEQITITTKDEFGEIAHRFNETTETLRVTVRTIVETSERMQEQGVSLSANMEQTAAATNEISANIDSVREQTIRQTESMNGSAASLEQITRNIENLDLVIQDQAANVNESSASVEEMVANIRAVTHNVERTGEMFEQVVTASQNGREKLLDVNRRVQQVNDLSTTLVEANKAISGIAAQTNLLAMNAAIEAAHAGESGRGFAVVADEVRKLAEHAQKESKRIQHELKSIREAITSAVETSEASSREFTSLEDLIEQAAALQSEVKASMQEQSTGSREVLGALQKIGDITSQVVAGSREMRSGNQSILEETGKLRQITEHIRQSMEEISRGAQEINGSVTAVAEIADTNKELGDMLTERTRMFRLEA